MRNTDARIIDAEFRVIPTSPPDTLKLQHRRTQGRVGCVLVTLAAAAAIAGVASGHLVGGFIASLSLAGVAAMLTENQKSLGLASLALAVLLATNGCSKEPKPRSPAHADRAQAETQASIREATTYRDPRAGFRPKPVVVGRSPELDEEKSDVRH
ncbi:MAG: hypothetical protein ACRES5_17265 [Pseudomonas sp.]|uniref:hypothetical protein n=1 Tax=Stenotrophomonas sp. TaxID=69392 RepID=UPI003D6D3072